MECKDCAYRWQDEEDNFPRCHWVSRCPDDKAPCDYDDTDYIKITTDKMVGGNTMMNIDEMIKDRLREVLEGFDFEEKVNDMINYVLEDYNIEERLDTRIKEKVEDLMDDCIDEAIDDFINDELDW